MERTLEITISSDKTLETIGQCVKRVKKDLQNGNIKNYPLEQIIKDLHFMISFIEDTFMQEKLENDWNFEAQMKNIRKKINLCLAKFMAEWETLGIMVLSA